MEVDKSVGVEPFVVVIDFLTAVFANFDLKQGVIGSSRTPRGQQKERLTQSHSQPLTPTCLTSILRNFSSRDPMHASHSSSSSIMTELK